MYPHRQGSYPHDLLSNIVKGRYIDKWLGEFCFWNIFVHNTISDNLYRSIYNILGELEIVHAFEFSADIAELPASGQLESVLISKFSADIAEFPASGQLESVSVSEFSAYIVEFSEAGNSKFGELEAGNSKRRTRYLPISSKSYVY